MIIHTRSWTRAISPCAWFFGGKRKSGGQRKTLRKFYLDLLRKLQVDSNDDSALYGSKGNLRNILELICNEPVEFNLRLDHGLFTPCIQGQLS